MDTRGKTNAEFRNEVNEALARHESSFDQVNATLQAVLTELQALCNSSANHSQPKSTLCTEGSVHHPHTTTAITNRPTFSQHLKLNFPRFNGEDPINWIYRLASFHLEGIALQWHRWLTKFRGPLSWNDFTKAILLRFGPIEYEDPSEALSRLKQTTTVAAYQEAFEGLSHQVDGLPEPFLIGCFIVGLHDDIRLDVKIKQPRTLASAIGVARLIEERNLLQKKTTTPSQKGLCYYCDEKYFQGHRCELPQLFMITNTPPEEEEGINTLPEISFHAITGGRLKNKDLTVLIDGGSTHNFIDQTVKKLQVIVANQERIECMGQCPGLMLTIQGIPVTTDYYILPVAAC
ncbi:hypothetical protein AAG906_035879 [Vitis piasezkii]